MTHYITSKYSITATDSKKNINYALKFTDYNVEHNHDYYELFIVSDGKFEHVLNGEKTILTSGNAFLLRPTDRHRFKALSNRVEHINIMIKSSYFKKSCKVYSDDLIDSLHNLEFIKLSLINSSSQALLAKLYKLENEKNEERTNLLEKVIVNEILIAVIEQTKILRGEMPTWFETLLEKIKGINNIAWTVDDVVSQCDYSKTHVERLFRKYTNNTIKFYLLKNKMDYASHYLLYSNKSIKEISETIGYSDISHFTNAFKKNFNMTPKQYRKTMTKDHLY